MKEGVVIEDQIVTTGTVVMVKANGSIGKILKIGRCGLVALDGPLTRPYAPSELQVIRKGDEETDGTG
jgi:hypothetical protein